MWSQGQGWLWIGRQGQEIRTSRYDFLFCSIILGTSVINRENDVTVSFPVFLHSFCFIIYSTLLSMGFSHYLTQITLLHDLIYAKIIDLHNSPCTITLLGIFSFEERNLLFSLEHTHEFFCYGRYNASFSARTRILKAYSNVSLTKSYVVFT